MRIVGYSNVPLPKNLIASDEILDQTALAALIEQSLLRPQFGRITTNRVVFSLPESKSFIRVIHIPEMTDEEAENAVLFEAEAYIPLPMDQVYFDWQILGRSGGRMEVLLIASPKDFVDKYISALEKANLKIVAVEVESQSVVRALVPAGSSDNLLIADLDAYKTALIMVISGHLQFTSSVPIAGNAFTERIMQALSVDQTKAEGIKKDFGIASTDEYPNLQSYLLPVVNDLSAEIKNILKFHYEHSQVPVGKLVLSGGTAKLKHLDEFLSPTLAGDQGLAVSIADPLLKLNLSAAANLTSYEALSFTTAIGLAMRFLSET